ncbi:MAG: 1,4-dihydroxy-2-naphthoate octaprenyltransferase [Bacteroidaceae bacterium]|nr:1,4-dihydroxy-2-naphthoate octaprenyltransferase [Bacteroidaceae bacterium]
MKTNSLKAWFLAARPKTLTAALIPVTTATAMAYADNAMQWYPAILCALFAIWMQIAANFINDLYDFKRGTDNAERLGPKRACAQGWITPRAMRLGVVVTLLIASSCGLSLLAYGGVTLIALGIICIIFAFLYSTLMSYHGMGDLLVWVFFGFVPVIGTYYVQADTITLDVWLLSAACGLCVDTLLVLNNYRDRETDRETGKRTIVVIFGERFGSLAYLLQGIAAYLCVAFLSLNGNLWLAILPAFYLLPHYLTWRKMVQINRGKELNRILGFTSRNMLTFALLVVLAYMSDKILPMV